ncbi:MAG: hypothetical protein IPJ89_02615 [Candidatus Iainarchaeum archaeon]|uniref:Uncharacterized protein n=1 Tax=Candidatus Iainarchaeum sp. TaxID=3101447 RepID=A0A7T9DKR8_9ARCH|nr:MAG: hypothetical protein IPJ89_02615 [Candidatus Diapherotrites archaeon]
MPPMHSSKGVKGFTLFTALLAFMLILVAGLLINTMVTTERTSKQVVTEVEAQSRMQTIADLARADALQVVNYGIRNAIEEYTQVPDNPYLYNATATTWQEVVDDFGRFFFEGSSGTSGGGNSILAGKIATNLKIIIGGNPRRISGFDVTIKGDQGSGLSDAVQQVLDRTAQNSQDYLQLVQCYENTAPYDCLGTFYVNLDFSLLDDDAYEKLPSIHVRDVATGREIVQPVIARSKFRIYVPLRVFKALKYAHTIAQTGLLTASFNQQLANAGVGLCDVGRCGYRTQPFTPGPIQVEGAFNASSANTGGYLCPSDQSGLGVFEQLFPKNIPVTCDAPAAALNICPVNQPLGTYNPAEAASRAAILDSVTQGLINNQVANVNLPYPNQFALLNPTNIAVTTTKTSIITKDIIFQGVGDIPASVGRCTKLAGATTTLVFEDTDKNYFVVDTRPALKYGVRIVNLVNSTLPRETCVSYCKDNFGFLDLLFGVNVTPTACPLTACVPSTIAVPPSTATPAPATPPGTGP